MKTLRFFACIAVLAAVCTIVSASETSDNFAKWVTDFSSSDLNKQRDSQQNWQNFCRQQGQRPEVQKEITRVSAEQLAKDNPVNTTVWIIRQLGAVGDATAVPALAKCLPSNEIRIRDEAARALANIPGKEAEDALKGNSVQSAKDAMTARTIKSNLPKETVETKFPQAIPYLPLTNAAEIRTFMEGYGKLSDMEKAQVLSNLTARSSRMQVSMQRRRPAARETNAGNRPGGNARGTTGTGRTGSPYIPLAVEAAGSSDETLRNAGLLAVGALGGTAEVPFLLEQARAGSNKDLAKLALVRMSGQEIDTLLMANLKTEQDAEKFGILADVLNRRYNSEIRPALLERAKAAGSENRLQLLQWAEPASSKSDIADYVKVWALISDRGQKDRAEQIIARLSGGDAGTVMQALGDWDTPEGLSLLGRVGDANMLDKIRQSKNAVHAFRTWTNAVVADDLIKVVGDDKYSDEERTLALRAFIRVMSLPNNQIGIQIDDVAKVKRLAEAYELAKRIEEKRLIIERVGQIRTVESLRFVLQYVDEEELQERACESILDLAHQVELKRTALDEFNAALDKVLAVTKRDDFRERVNRYKSQR
ncbi:MAG: HEAT repeat domain-containing protein [Planctomycetaceae bacterium]|jgi:HEAT repeat protein|nr:HEAT repeat domain-containing protein [Planctomycetaceae bacterium]